MNLNTSQRRLRKLVPLLVLSLSSSAFAQGLLDTFERNVDQFLGSQIDLAGSILNPEGLLGPRMAHNFGAFSPLVIPLTSVDDLRFSKFVISLSGSATYDTNALGLSQQAKGDWHLDGGLNLQWAFVFPNPPPAPAASQGADGKSHTKAAAAIPNVFSAGQTGWEVDVLAGYGTSRYDRFSVLDFNLLSAGAGVTYKFSDPLSINLVDLESFTFDGDFDNEKPRKNSLAATLTWVLPILDGKPAQEGAVAAFKPWTNKVSVSPAFERNWYSDSSRDQSKPSLTVQYARKQQKRDPADKKVLSFSVAGAAGFVHFDSGRDTFDAQVSAKAQYVFLAKKHSQGAFTLGVSYANHQDDDSVDYDKFVFTPNVGLQFTF